MLFDLPPDPPKLWLPPKPAIIRNAPEIIRPALPEFCFVPGCSPAKARHALLTFVGSNAYNASNVASRTFTAQAIGSTPALVIVCAMGGESNSGGSSQYTGVSIGGNAATIHANPGGGREPTAIASLFVASGSTADIVVTRTGATGNHYIVVYTLTNYRSATPQAIDSGVNSSSTGITSRSATMDIRAGGVALYASSKGGNGATTWGSATKDFEDTSLNGVSAASKRSRSALSSHVETASFASTYAGICGVSWA